MGDDDPNAIGIAALDECDSSGGVGLRVSPHLFQGLLEMFQALSGFCRPHQQVMPQPTRVTLGQLATLDEVELEAPGGQEESRIPLGAEGYFTSEQVPVEVHRPVQFGHELDR